MTVLAAYNIKGGVGKTAADVNLASLSAQDGARTLLWDLDPQGAASFYFRARPKKKVKLKGMLRGRRDPRKAVRGTDFDGLDILPADFSARNLDLLLNKTRRPARPLRRLLKRLGKNYDRIYLDCAPGIGLASECVFAISDALVVPSIPTVLSVNTLEQLHGHMQTWGGRAPLVLPFFSMVDRRRKLHRDICGNAEDLPYEVLETVVPYSTHVERMGTERTPLLVYAGRSEPAAAYRSLHTEIRDRVMRGG